jgi:hypothetical protein
MEGISCARIDGAIGPGVFFKWAALRLALKEHGGFRIEGVPGEDRMPRLHLVSTQNHKASVVPAVNSFDQVARSLVSQSESPCTSGYSFSARSIGFGLSKRQTPTSTTSATSAIAINAMVINCEPSFRPSKFV